METVLEQYQELKETNELGVGSLEQYFPNLDEDPELAKAINYLINRTARRDTQGMVASAALVPEAQPEEGPKKS